MSDKYRIRHNDKMIQLQLDNKIDDMNNDFKEDINKSYFSVVTSIFNYIKNYLLRLGKPSFQNRQAKYKVDSEEYNKNNIEIVNDLRNSFLEINELKNILKNNLNYSITFNEFIKNQLNKLEDKTKDLKVYIDNPNKNIITINENFRDIKTIDVHNTTATVKRELGQVTLGVSSYKKQMTPESEGTKVEILDSSNGFAGNFQQVVTGGNDENIFLKRDVNPAPKDKRSWEGSNIKYLYEKIGSLNMNPAKIIDNNPDTCFEYELCNVPDKDKAKTCHNEYEENFKCTKKGWNWHYEYDDGSKKTWAKNPENGVLKLDLRITLPEPKYANYIDIDSFVIPYDDYKQSFENFEVREVKIAPHEKAEREIIYHRDIDIEKSYLDKIPEYENFGQDTDNSNRIFNFRPKDVQVIEIYLEQPNSYDCWIGHRYGWMDVKYKIEKKFIFWEYDTDYVESHNRIPIAGINRDAVTKNLEAGFDLGEIIGAGLVGAGIGAGFAALAGFSWNPIVWIAAILGIFLLSEDVSKVYETPTAPWLEAFKGWRYAIGIRDVNLNSYIYEPEGTVITKNYEIPKPVKKIEMSFVEDIPSIFYSNETEQTHYRNSSSWIKHYFSIDDGTTWYPITENKNDSKIPSVYYVNTEPVDINYTGKIGYIDSEEEVKKIMFKSDLKRPTDLEDAKYFTPILDNITAKIEVVPEEEDLSEY